MADHKVTINPGYVLDPSTIGGPGNPIHKNDTVTFSNQAGDSCMLHFTPPTPFGKPEIGPIANGGSESPKVIATVRHQQSFPYTCTGVTATASLGTPSDPGDGIIIVDPPGGEPGGSKSKQKRPAPPKKKAAAKPKSSKGKGKTKGKSKGKTSGKKKSKTGGRKKRR